MTRNTGKSAKKPALTAPKRQGASTHADTGGRSAKREPRRVVNGIPLKRKAVWLYDTDSPEFNAVWERERELLRTGKPDPDLDAFLEAAARDIDEALDGR